MKHLVLTLVLVVGSLLAHANTANEDNYTDSLVTVNTYRYLCNTIFAKETMLKGNTIYFSGKANQIISDIYSVADCIGDINMIKDSIPNRTYINKLQAENNARRVKFLMLNRANCNYIVHNKNNSTELTINSPVRYKDAIYQEYKIMNTKSKLYYTIAIQVNKVTLEPIRHYIKKMEY